MPVSSTFIDKLKKTTSARIGIGHSGGRYPTKAQLKFQEDYALAKDSIWLEVDPKLIHSLGLIELRTQAENRRDYLMQTRLGRLLHEESQEKLKLFPTHIDVQILTSCGLSGEAFKNVPPMLELLVPRFKQLGLRLAPVLYIPRARVAIMDAVGEITRPKTCLLLVGERPGLGTVDSLSAYFEYEPCLKRVESDRNVLSNIHTAGIPPTEAALMLADAIKHILQEKKSGMHVRFEFA